MHYPLAAGHILTRLVFGRWLNQSIRADTNNGLLLRTEMLPFDDNVIREASAGSNSRPAKILRAKMAREAMFRPLISWEEQQDPERKPRT